MPQPFQPHDVYADEAAFLMQVLKTIPDFVKQASEPLETASGYALVLQHPDGSHQPFYAIHDAGNSYISGLYLSAYGEEMPPTMRKVAAARTAAALRAFGLQYDPLLDTWAAPLKGEIPEPYVDALEEPAGQKVASVAEDPQKVLTYLIKDAQHLPLRSLEDIVAADEWFRENWRDLDPRYRREAGVKLAGMLGAVGLVACEEARSYASQRVNPDLSTQIELRMDILENLDAPIEALHALKDVADLTKTATPEAFAESLYAFDTAHHLTTYWDHQIFDPYQTVFGSGILGPTLPQNVQRRVDSVIAADDEALVAAFGRPVAAPGSLVKLSGVQSRYLKEHLARQGGKK